MRLGWKGCTEQYATAPNVRLINSIKIQTHISQKVPILTSRIYEGAHQ
jgi:hypothetical protein